MDKMDQFCCSNSEYYRVRDNHSSDNNDKDSLQKIRKKPILKDSD